MDLQMFGFWLYTVVTNPIQNRVKITTFLMRRRRGEDVRKELLHDFPGYNYPLRSSGLEPRLAGTRGSHSAGLHRRKLSDIANSDIMKHYTYDHI